MNQHDQMQKETTRQALQREMAELAKERAHVNETQKNEHGSDDVLNKSGNVNMMREALQSALDAMNLHCFMYPHMDKGFMVDAREKSEQALAAEPAPLVRLTDKEIDELFKSHIGKHVTEFANAIMDAMIEKNKGKL